MIAWSPPPDFPPSLVALIDSIFGEVFLITHSRLARGLQKKPSVLKTLGDQGAIRYRLHGARRVYAREDVAAYLGRKLECPSTALATKQDNLSHHTGITTSSSHCRAGRVVDFRAAQACGRRKMRKSTRTRSA